MTQMTILGGGLLLAALIGVPAVSPPGAPAPAIPPTPSTPTAPGTLAPPVIPGEPRVQNSDRRPAVVRYSDNPGTAAASLADRWKWAIPEAGRQKMTGGCWIGYSIDRMMGERTFIGSFYSDERRNRPTLGEIVTGMRVDEQAPAPGRHSRSWSGMGTMGGKDEPERRVRKEVGLLFHIAGNGSDAISDLSVSNLSLNVDFEGDPLIWLGSGGLEESVSFLEAAFKQSKSPDLRGDLLMAIGLHSESPRAIGFLKEVLLGSGEDELREDAAFWLGQTQTDDARKILLETAWKDRSDDVREKAIFSMSQMDGEAVIDDMIALAKGHKNLETRKKAAFWLGQKASGKAVGALKDIAFRDEETEVQRSAMFALTQLDDGGGVDELIRIARTHPNPKIRRDAIFWLGQSEDPSALELLVAIVKGK